MNTDNASQVMIKVFDNKGSLMKVQRAISSVGINQLNVDIKSFANGVYSISIDLDNGQLRKTIQVVKQ